ncbi:FAD/NAD(P)-binding domain-containing protein [Cryphonectria parasitica EP155]|uniref:FAD/NAD(P)-binding domain-containing protein n=1 Tax=Cryphonectria parasitica (strain ATCC 38755 / EP155) TaxID=660469 RepID=A0A9P5CI00_CRYP1|nr:FAD/NAD(P)-binding domain-containing protein [Cryphonectria parasitica EP155]KAF3760429.1 FAD/NAD(P)-binding domain-containing protein [Cryphonectria parasitica EP155]
MVALGLLHRGFQVHIYERSSAQHEIGAAFAFTAVARDCMARLSPSVLAALSQIGEATKNEIKRYWDGFSPQTKQEAESEEKSLLFSLSTREPDYWGCLRSLFLTQMASRLPPDTVQFSKELESYIDEGSDKVLLRFTDGTTAEADALVGCDGIHSRTRELLLGESDPASHAHYSHKMVYRALLPIGDGVKVFGHDKANNHCMHLGPNAHITSYPVANWTLLNVVIGIHDTQEWPDISKMVLPSTRDEVKSAVHNWSPAVQDLVSMFPKTLSKWGIFDTARHPASTYARSRVCLVGDSAHAMSPFMGAGACMGVEDALVLATALGSAALTPEYGDRKNKAISAAFQAYSSLRLVRSQAVVQSSRDVGDIYQWRYPATRQDSTTIETEIKRRTRSLWDFDVEKMIGQVKDETESRVRASSS